MFDRALLTAAVTGATVLALAGCTTHATPAATPSGGLLRIHDPGHVTYSLHPTDCHAGPGPTPDHHCTPGAVDPDVTQDNLKATICKSGYTATVRPPVSETGPAKRSQYQAYSIPDGTTSELDHLVPLELGGANDIANLWPENRQTFMGASEKDDLENYLNLAVCSRKEPLSQAQHDIATDWVAAYCKARLPKCPGGLRLMQDGRR